MLSKAQTEQLESYRTKYPAIDRLWVMLSNGDAPNFLDVMSAISQIVDFLEEGDTQEVDIVCDLLKMSGKKCLFCS